MVLGLLLADFALAQEPSVSAPSEDIPAALRAVREDEARRVETFERAARTVVCIFADPLRAGGGSGVLIREDGYGLTNYHVVAQFLEKRAGFGGLSDGKLYPLKIIGIDAGGDIALFKLEGKEKFECAPLGDSDTLQLGQWVAAMGNPFLLAEDYSPTITLGVISGLHRYQGGTGNALEYADCIQVSTSINPGNSGGPLFDLRGRVIGINGRASFEERGRVNVGLGYAVTINQIKRFLPGLWAGRLCEHGTLGATVSRAGDRLIFNAVQEDAPAARAGVHLADELLAVAGRPVRTPNEFNNAITVLPANWPVLLKLRRDGRELTTVARLERLPVRGLPPFQLDLRYNHGQIRELLDRYEAGDRKQPGRRVAQLAWRGRFTHAGGALRQAADLSVMQDAAGLLQVQKDGEALTLRLADDPQTPPGRGPTDEAWRDPAFWALWQQATGPLLARPKIELGWELLGGDEVGGRVAWVLERRLASGRRVRWKFDFQTDQLLQIAIGDEQQPEAAVWTPDSRREGGGLRWPRIWTLHSQLGEQARLEIESLAPVFAE